MQSFFLHFPPPNTLPGWKVGKGCAEARPGKHFPREKMGVKEWNLEKTARIPLKSSTSTVQKLVQATRLEDSLIREGESPLLSSASRFA